MVSLLLTLRVATLITARQTTLDHTMDEIKRRYGADKAMRALALKHKRKTDPG